MVERLILPMLMLTTLVRAFPVAVAQDISTTASIAWTVPDVDRLPLDIYGRTVRYGRDLIAHTSALIGPDAADPKMRYAGNGLECQSCHVQAGTKEFAIPLVGLWGVFPTFIGRENEVRTIEDRVNGCMDRSMNGRELPDDGLEMKAIVTYIRAISEAVPVGKSVSGRGLPILPLPQSAANLAHGEEVYVAKCALCHQKDGRGVRLDPADAAAQKIRYQFPPVWGPDSYNDGAGLARPITLANFVHANMPLGTDFRSPVLSDRDAFDVAAYVSARPRPRREGNENDYPDRSLKPVDALYAPLLGPFPPLQHLVGPWAPMRQWMHDNAAQLRGSASQ
jgi:thiosulfate dehydrogenase